MSTPSAIVASKRDRAKELDYLNRVETYSNVATVASLAAMFFGSYFTHQGYPDEFLSVGVNAFFAFCCRDFAIQAGNMKRLLTTDRPSNVIRKELKQGTWLKSNYLTGFFLKHVRGHKNMNFEIKSPSTRII